MIDEKMISSHIILGTVKDDGMSIQYVEQCEHETVLAFHVYSTH
jgi:hypothetical protein